MKITKDKSLLVLLLALSITSFSQKSDNNSVKMMDYGAPMKIPVNEFFRNPQKSSFQISPDGKTISYLAPFEKRMNIFIEPVDGGKAVQLTSYTDRDIAQYAWANNDALVYLKDESGDENYQLFILPVKAGKAGPVTKPGSRVEIVDMLENDPDHIAFAMNSNNPQLFDLYKLNVRDGSIEQVAENPGNISSWIFDRNGELRLATATDGVNASVLKWDQKTKWIPLVTTNFKENLSPLFFDFDNKNFYCASNIGRDRSAIVLYDLDNNKEEKVIFDHPVVDVYDLNYSRKRKVLTSISYEVDKPEKSFLDDLTKARYREIQSQVPSGNEIVITDMDDEETKCIVMAYSDRSRGAYYLYDFASKKLKLIEKMSPWLDEAYMAEMKPITFTSQDGLTLHGYLTLPQNGKQSLPLVVNPHGGPWARDSWGFNPEVQFLASRGYAVLQVNFRGSVGYGRKFWESSFKQWGQKMQDDLTNGVQYLIKERIIDPNRIAIYGGSYGGYATLAGLTYTPDLYRCGVDYVGVSNLFSFLKTIPPYWQPYLEMMHEMVGDPEVDSEMMEAFSPALHADKIKVPLFVAQGANDPRVNKKESDQIVDALRANGVPVEYMLKQNEGHGFRNEENKIEFYMTMEKFLSQNMQPLKKEH